MLNLSQPFTSHQTNAFKFIQHMERVYCSVMCASISIDLASHLKSALSLRGISLQPGNKREETEGLCTWKHKYTVENV